jgi:hypothetical protein
MQKLAESWKAIIAFAGVYLATQLPAIEIFVQDWIQGVVSAVFVSAAVWLKANA